MFKTAFTYSFTSSSFTLTFSLSLRVTAFESLSENRRAGWGGGEGVVNEVFHPWTLYRATKRTRLTKHESVTKYDRIKCSVSDLSNHENLKFSLPTRVWNKQ